MKSHLLTKSLLIAATLALGFSGRALAQTATAPAAPAATSSSTYDSNAPGVGLLGSRYVGLDYGYLRYDQPRSPRSGHEFGAAYNQPLMPGLDFTAAVIDTSTGYFTTHPRSTQALAGLTAYQSVNSWLKPYLSGQAGVAFNRDAQLFSDSGILTHDSHNVYDHDNFDYVLSAGAEFQVLPALVVTPFVSYQEIHRFYHDWDYGVKATYRLSRHWSVSVTPQIDEHKELAYLGGINFHF
jgi:opacity protein-like surface antigen